MEDKKRDVILSEPRFHLAQHVRQFWVVDAQEGTTVDDVLSPGYWAHVAPRLSRFDRITVQLETGEWMLEVLVMDVARNWARVQILHHFDLTTGGKAVDTPEDPYEVKWGGPHHKYRVIRRSDKEPISTGHTDAETARAWLRNYEQTIAG